MKQEEHFRKNPGRDELTEERHVRGGMLLEMLPSLRQASLRSTLAVCSTPTLPPNIIKRQVCRQAEGILGITRSRFKELHDMPEGNKSGDQREDGKGRAEGRGR